jgi:Tol biopolymer transport system component
MAITHAGLVFPICKTERDERAQVPNLICATRSGTIDAFAIVMRFHIAIAGSLALSLVACAGPRRIGLHPTEAATALTQITRGPHDEVRPAVARDGRSVAYESRGAGGLSQIEVLPLDGSAPARVVVRANEPSWFPGSAGLVCISRKDPQGETTQLVQAFGERASAFTGPLGHPFVDAAWPSVSPDGHWVALSLGNAHVFQTHTRTSARFDPALALLEARGTGTTALGRGAEPTWSPDGSRIAFVRQVDGRAHVFVAAPHRGATATQITEGADDDALPAWSPDGSLIAFCSSPVSNGVARNSNLFVVKPDGNGLRQLTEGDADACRPAWGPGGTLYFHANADGRFHIWRVTVLASKAASQSQAR